MSSQDEGQERAGLLATLTALNRDNAGLGLMLHQAIAAQFGLNPTDLKALDLARHEPRLTAGRLAELTGMSTSATTALLDRLERRGFIRRERDPDDRRRVYVVSTGRREAELDRAYAPLTAAMTASLDRYDDTQLAFLLDVARETNRIVRELLDSLHPPRGGTSPPVA